MVGQRSEAPTAHSASERLRPRDCRCSQPVRRIPSPRRAPFAFLDASTKPASRRGPTGELRMRSAPLPAPGSAEAREGRDRADPRSSSSPLIPATRQHGASSNSRACVPPSMAAAPISGIALPGEARSGWQFGSYPPWKNEPFDSINQASVTNNSPETPLLRLALRRARIARPPAHRRRTPNECKHAIPGA